MTERDVLTTLYNNTGGPSWTTSTNWLSDFPLGSWYGVSTDSDGRVIELEFYQNHLAGPIPPELGQLQNLTRLNLNYNNLTGPIPPELGQLQNLTYLGLFFNQLTGDIPSWIGQMQKLENLQLGRNQLTGDIPSWIGQLQKLMSLGLSNNPLEGSIPPELGQLQQLGHLGLSNNLLEGSIPPELGQMQKLMYLGLSNNLLEGSIPPELGQLQQLGHLGLSNNLLEGSIPPELGQLQNLRFLSLSGNELTDSIPSELGQLQNLEVVQFPNNSLSGRIPPELGQLQNLRFLSLSGNELTGSIPSELGQLQNLSSVQLQDNSLSGRIPPELGQLQNLEWLNLSENDISGPIPPELGQLQNLKYLYLSKLQLSGSIPPELGQLQNLRTLSLGSNQLSGSIPSELGFARSLESLNFSSNQLTGVLPESFGYLDRLKTLNATGNTDLSGALPLTLVNLDLEKLLLGDTLLCAPADPAFQNWIRRILLSRVATCGSGNGQSSAYLTQATQSLAYPVPLVAGEDALLRVFVTKQVDEYVARPTIRAAFYQDGSEVSGWIAEGWEIGVPGSINEGNLSLSANIPIPGSNIAPGLEMVVEIDPDGTLDPALGLGDRIPPTGRIQVDVRDVPPLDLTVVPFLWTENPDYSIVGQVEALTADDELFRLTRDILPVGDFSLTLHDPVWTSVDPVFNIGPSLFSELDVVRTLEGSTGHYMGVLRGGGGWANQPGFLSVSGLYDATIAHELGHNFSLGHAPCGNPRNTDTAYPYPDGSIGAWGYDMRAGTMVSPDTPDVMGYCGSPDWISDYHFTKAMGYRVYREVLFSRIAASYGSTTRGLLVWGGVNENGELVLEPAFVVDAPPVLPREDGPYEITGEDEGGGVLFQLSFVMKKIADGEGSAFTFVLPVQPDWPGRLYRITLSGPEGDVEIEGDDGPSIALLIERGTGRVRGILRDWPAPGESVQAARRTLPEPGLDVVISNGIPAPADWEQ